MAVSTRAKQDLCNGPLLKGMFLYALPVMATGVLQTLYNAADTMVIGQFRGDESLAAVSSTGSITNLLVNLFLGLSTGVLTVAARHIGARHHRHVQQTVHTAMLLSLICGVILAAVGLAFSTPILQLMGTGEGGVTVLSKAALYMRIYFLGAPAFLVYNFGAAVLRAAGDTKRPLLFLTASGLLNVVLNVVLVALCGMDVEGVAIATIASQYLSAALVVRCLMKEQGDIHFTPSHMRINRTCLREILHMGIPSGIQSALFSFSNVLIQSTINSFGPLYVAGSGAAAQIENVIYTATDSFYTTTMAFTGQNFGARKKKRIRNTMLYGLLLNICLGLLIGITIIVFADPLLRIFTSNPTALQAGRERMVIIAGSAFICSGMNIFAAHLRGLGSSIVPMITTLSGVCGLRVVWLFTVLPFFSGDARWQMLFLCYPITWLVTTVSHFIYSRIYDRRVLGAFTDAEDIPVPTA